MQNVESRCLRGPSRWTLLRLVFLGRRDVVVIQKWTPPVFLVSALRFLAGILIFDCDDAIYLPVTPSGSTTTSNRNRVRLARALHLFDGATTSTELIATDLRIRAPGLRTLVYPGPIPNSPRDERNIEERAGLVWLGSPATEGYLLPWFEALRSIESEIELTVMGGGAASAGQGVRVLEWSLSEERALLGRSLLGLFVQPDGEWEARKSGYKILEYIAAGVLPVAQKTAAAIDLLGNEYPFFFEDETGLNNAIRGSIDLSVEDRQALLGALVAQSSQYSYASVVAKWIVFVDELTAVRE